ncbi:MAG: Glutathione import ATP-binding protein GsiA [Pseudomonadota bacterium]
MTIAENRQATVSVDGLSIDLVTEAGVSRAVQALALSIDRGETFALVGESGCGKSMTAMALLRLLPENALIRSGEMRLAGEDIFALREQDMQRVRGRRMSVIFQEPATSLNPVMSIGDQMTEAIRHHLGLDQASAWKRSVEWLEKVGLPEPERRMKGYPFELSGGQLQRVMIAIALAAEPDLLIADEPTTALDVTIQAQILSLLQSLQRERGMALMLITHDLAVVKGMAQRVALMYAGQIVEVAESTSFFAKPQHPYARLLLDAMPEASKRGQSLAAIEGTVPPLTELFVGCRFAPRCPWAQSVCREGQIELRSAPDGTRAIRCLPVSEGAALAPLAARVTEHGGPHATPDGLAETPALLSVQDLRVTYTLGGGFLQAAKTFDAVRGVGFEIKPGQTLALVGESGCGKTTTGKALLSILGPRARVTGSVALQGESLLGAGRAAIARMRKDLQIIFQNPFASLSPRQRVKDILEEGMLSLHPEWTPDDRQRILRDLMEQVGLRADTLSRYPHEFSGGQRQRIAIARALAVRPKLIVCDEPTSALDVSVQAQILNLLKSLQKDLGVSYLLITHNIGVVAYLGDEVAVMQRGLIVEQGGADQVLNRPSHPYTQTLLSAVPQL